MCFSDQFSPWSSLHFPLFTQNVQSFNFSAQTSTEKVPAKVPDINQVLTNNNRDEFNGFTLGFRTQILKLPRFQRIRKAPSPVQQDEDSKKDLSDQEEIIRGSDSETDEVIEKSKSTFNEKIKESESKMRKRKAGSVSSFFTSSSEEDSSSAASESELDTSSLSDIDELPPIIPKSKEVAKKIYSDSDSEDEIKVVPNKRAAGGKSRARLYSDTFSEDDDLSMDEHMDDKVDSSQDKVKTPEPVVNLDEIVQPPRTPGRESSPVEPKKTNSLDYDRLYSDSEDEREYQEKRRRNTEYMEQIEREFMEEQQRQQTRAGETTEEDEALPEKAPSPGDPLTPSISKLPPTPDIKLTSDPLNKQPISAEVSNEPVYISKKAQAAKKAKMHENKQKELNGLDRSASMSETTEDEMQKGKLSPASCSSQESQTSHVSQVQMEHCYSLPPSASPSLSSPPPQLTNEISKSAAIVTPTTQPVSSSAFVHDHGYMTSTTASAAIPSQSTTITVKPAAKGPGRPRKDPNQPKKPKKTKATSAIVDNSSPIPTHKSQSLAQFVPREIYKDRSPREQVMLLYEFLTKGIDGEDIAYIRRSYEFLLQDDANNSWLNATHFMDHCETERSLLPPPNKKRKKDDDLRRHASGSARTEGFYKLDIRDKLRFKYHHSKSINESEMEDEVKSKIASKMQGSREARSNQRRLLTAFGASTESELLKFNQLKFRKKQLKFAKSSIHDWGLFAMEPIAADEMVIEYVGQMIRPVVADLRETKYEAIGIGSSYLFRIDLETIIDATKCGNLARFINHSCNVSIATPLKFLTYTLRIAFHHSFSFDFTAELLCESDNH